MYSARKDDFLKDELIMLEAKQIMFATTVLRSH